MHICRPLYKIMDSKNYIMHAYYLRAWWEYSANRIRAMALPNQKKIKRLDICQAAPARLPCCTRPAIKRLLICLSSRLVR